MKKEINRTLGNSLRCILPSFWWKRLLGKMVDKIESAESSASSAMKMATLAGAEASDKQDRLVSGSNIKTINHQSILGSGNLDVTEEPIIFIPFADTEEGKALNAKAYQQYIDDNSEYPNVAINAIFGFATVVTSRRPISNASEHQYITLIWCDFGGNIRETHIHSDGSISSVEESHFDSELSDTSINAVQNKVITASLNTKADKADIKTINGVSLLGGGNLQLGDGQTIVYDDSAVYERIAEVEELAAQAKVSSELAIEELNIHLEEVNEGLLEQVSQLLKDMDDLSARVRALENK